MKTQRLVRTREAVTDKEISKMLSQAAKVFGAMGGAAGKGKAKQRGNSSYYAAIGKKGMASRWGKKAGGVTPKTAAKFQAEQFELLKP